MRFSRMSCFQNVIASGAKQSIINGEIASAIRLPRNDSFMLRVCLILLLFLPACQQTSVSNNTFIFEQSVFMMGTLANIQVVAQDAQTANTAMSAAFARMQAIEEELSDYRPDSAVSQISQQAGQQPVKVSRELFNLLVRSKEWGRLSDGAFDVTIGAITKLWDFEKGVQPQADALAAALLLVDYRKLELDEAKQTAYLTLPGMRLNLGAIGKGYAADEAVRILKEKGIKAAIVNAGGNLSVLGSKAPNQPWKIGLQHPRKPKEFIATIPLEDKAALTSGDYERFFIKDGVRYHHILNPKNGQPSADLISVTIIAPTAEPADALSTAVFVLGVKKGLELVATQPGVEALLITAKGEIITTANFPGTLKDGLRTSGLR